MRSRYSRRCTSCSWYCSSVRKHHLLEGDEHVGPRAASPAQCVPWLARIFAFTAVVSKPGCRLEDGPLRQQRRCVLVVHIVLYPVVIVAGTVKRLNRPLIDGFETHSHARRVHVWFEVHQPNRLRRHPVGFDLLLALVRIDFEFGPTETPAARDSYLGLYPLGCSLIPISRCASLSPGTPGEWTWTLPHTSHEPAFKSLPASSGKASPLRPTS